MKICSAFSLIGYSLRPSVFDRLTQQCTGEERALSTTITLSDTCPASFELKDGGCYLRNRYREYRSLRDAGVGGLKTGLPPLREGFSPQQIDLGRYLFFDPALSADGSISCASCHDPAQGFSDGRAQAVGINGQTLPRSAPSLWNVGFLYTLLWDGSKASLEEQMQGPLFLRRDGQHADTATGNAEYQ